MQNPGSMLRLLLPEGPRGTMLAASCVPRRTWSGFSKPGGDARAPAGGGSGEASVGRAAGLEGGRGGSPRHVTDRSAFLFLILVVSAELSE